MPLYRVIVEIDVMIAADNEDEASARAQTAVAEEIRWNGQRAMKIGPPCEVTKARNLGEWKDAHPYNGKGSICGATCTEYLGARTEGGGV